MDTPLLDGAARLPTPPALIVVDVDGTLLTTTHEVTPATAREVQRVRASGGGPPSREPRAMLPVLRALGLPACSSAHKGRSRAVTTPAAPFVRPGAHAGSIASG